MSRTKGVKNKTHHIWSEEEKAYLSEITPGRGYSEIHKMMNDKFEYQFSLAQIKAAMTRYNIRNGLDGKFKKNYTPWNKGLKGVRTGGKSTQFKKGQVPLTCRPVGSERVNVDGYIEIKTADPSTWELKHRVVYEKHNGKIPKEHAVIFLDKNKLNFDIDNLALVSKKELLQLNRSNLLNNDPELTKAGVNLVKVIIKTNERSRQ